MRRKPHSSLFDSFFFLFFLRLVPSIPTPECHSFFFNFIYIISLSPYTVSISSTHAPFFIINAFGVHIMLILYFSYIYISLVPNYVHIHLTTSIVMNELRLVCQFFACV